MLQPAIVTGIPISDGLAVGPAYIHRDTSEMESHERRISPSSVESELARIHTSVREVHAELDQSARHVERELGHDMASILRAYQFIVDDQSLWSDFEAELRDQLVDAETVVSTVLGRQEHKLRELTNATLSQRSDDVTDITRRILRHLRGDTARIGPECVEGCVFVVHRLLTSTCLQLPERNVAAVLVERPESHSHAAIFVRQFGIPVIAGLERLIRRIGDGDRLLIDGSAGSVAIRPTPAQRDEFQQRLADQQRRQTSAKGQSHEPAVTRSGRRIDVMANAGSRAEVMRAVNNGADGIGLLRIEQLFLTRNSRAHAPVFVSHERNGNGETLRFDPPRSAAPSPSVIPSEDELLCELRTVLEPVGDRLVTVRLLDTGGDKPIPELAPAHEPWPMLGRRGVRLLFDHPALLHMQLRVLMLLSEQFDLRILVPMVTTADDMRQVWESLNRTASEMNLSVPPLGAMIETPAAALCVREIARHADFLSIGTNDLTQYTMVAGRDSPSVAEYFNDEHPAVLRLIGIVGEEAGDCPISVCGELAASPNVLDALLSYNVRSLSVAPPLVANVKQRVRQSETLLPPET
ncbi:MAG: phosphoenolpyruvate--protein phosphotransferase [Planctomycetota bacterium]